MRNIWPSFSSRLIRERYQSAVYWIWASRVAAAIWAAVGPGVVVAAVARAVGVTRTVAVAVARARAAVVPREARLAALATARTAQAARTSARHATAHPRGPRGLRGSVPRAGVRRGSAGIRRAGRPVFS